MIFRVNADLIFMCVYVYQWDSAWLQAWCRSSGVHVVKQTVYLPQRNSSSSVTDLEGGRGKDDESDPDRTSLRTSSNSSKCLYNNVVRVSL